MFKPNHTGIQN